MIDVMVVVIFAVAFDVFVHGLVVAVAASCIVAVTIALMRISLLLEMMLFSLESSSKAKC